MVDTTNLFNEILKLKKDNQRLQKELDDMQDCIFHALQMVESVEADIADLKDMIAQYEWALEM